MNLVNFNWHELAWKYTRSSENGKVVRTLTYLVDDFYGRMMFMAGGRGARSELHPNNVHPSWLGNIARIWIQRSVEWM